MCVQASLTCFKPVKEAPSFFFPLFFPLDIFLGKEALDKKAVPIALLFIQALSRWFFVASPLPFALSLCFSWPLPF